MKTKADITLHINIGDTLLAGKFKNSRLLVKTITKNEKGEVLINGKQLLKMRIMNEDPHMSNMTKFQNQLAHAGVSVTKGGVLVAAPTYQKGWNLYSKHGSYRAKTVQEFIIKMGKLGYRKTGINTNHRQRPELHYQPIFEGLLGPMWDGDKGIRYEDPHTNNQLSAQVTAGENKTATWSKKFKSLEYFTSRNTTTHKQCDTAAKARAIIKNSGIQQTLKVVANPAWQNNMNQRTYKYYASQS